MKLMIEVEDDAPATAVARSAVAASSDETVSSGTDGGGAPSVDSPQASEGSEWDSGSAPQDLIESIPLAATQEDSTDGGSGPGDSSAVPDSGTDSDGGVPPQALVDIGFPPAADGGDRPATVALANDIDAGSGPTDLSERT